MRNKQLIHLWSNSKIKHTYAGSKGLREKNEAF